MVDSIREQRTKWYGDSGIFTRAFTKQVEAIVSQALQMEVVLPPQCGALIMVALKTLREAYRHKQDNVDDAKNYFDMAGEVGN